ncbi:hypothetical protein FJW07_30075 [Mesorhizobium sp. B3-1-9]|uniref:hypothetical protein n=1 Tax=Mesorhizobium sp. B3-1-9 TaxID=2589892 RepID=UPI001128812A|nr:hypothetical protein [Mesorhizobium sp. B3-1-9]TPI29759.1 hypothetical protein FJW07_30075 [Mesorhizobium sp. B3-1-9]
MYIATAISTAAFSFSVCWAGSHVEEAGCFPLIRANEVTIKLQATWDGVINSNPRVVRHSEVLYENGRKYERKAPYERWRGSPYSLNNNRNTDGTPYRSNCRRLREEVLGGVNTVVIAYTKTFQRPIDGNSTAA